MRLCLAFFFFLTTALANDAARVKIETLTDQLLSMVPNALTCANAIKYTTECRTAAQAADPIYCSFQEYNITNIYEQAAIISLILYESDEFKYNWGHFVDNTDVHMPGKGTRNMQSFSYNEKYARMLFPSDMVDQAKAQDYDAVLQLVSPDVYSFGSAAWFLATVCQTAVRTDLQTGSEKGFEQYIIGCIGGAMNDKRLNYWNSAKSALGA